MSDGDTADAQAPAVTRGAKIAIAEPLSAQTPRDFGMGRLYVSQ